MYVGDQAEVYPLGHIYIAGNVQTPPGFEYTVDPRSIRSRQIFDMFYAKLFVSIKKKKKKEQLDDNFRRIRDMHSSFFILLSRISRDSQSFRKQKMRITSHTYESFVSVRYQNTFFFNQIVRIWFKCSFKCDGQALPLYY